MKLACSTVCINSSRPIKQRGYLTQTKPIYNFHDDLHARIIAFVDDEQEIYHISCDLLGLPIEVQDQLQMILQETTEKKVHVIVSATHTHFAPDTRDLRYQAEVLDKLVYAIRYLSFVESSNVRISYQCVPFEGVGTSRISHHKANVLLQLFSIYVDENPWIQMIVHNCHPTIHNGYTPYFTSEYPGYVISELSRRFPSMYFTFIQGAAGDVSTRFTRPRQDASAVVELGNHMVNKITEMLCTKVEVLPLDTFAYEARILPIEHTFEPLDVTHIPEGLSERELYTIQEGVIMRENLSKKLDTLVKQIKVSKLDLGKYTLVFCPNEMFSSYIDCMDTSRSALCAYSNGYSSYVTGINDDFITYEKFTDTFSVNTKKKYMEILETFGK